jgi:hypothetical protein
MYDDDDDYGSIGECGSPIILLSYGIMANLPFFL